MDALLILKKYYPLDNSLRQMLLTHSWQVCNKALYVANHHPELKLNKQILVDGALLHDIGIFLTNAPSIHCFGNAHYLLHGIYGGILLRKEGFPLLARVCERHTGTGITRQNILNQHLPLPPNDYVPETLEEQVICYADKFFSKSSLHHTKTYEQAYQSLLKFGEEGAYKFKKWHESFN